MKARLVSYLLPTLLIFAAGTGLGLSVNSFFEKDDTFEQLQKLEDAFLLINRQYVDDVDARQLAEDAIRAMLKDLDPHSTFIDASRINGVQDEYRGEFGGIGIWFEAAEDDTAKVTNTLPDGPGERVGLMPGDRLIAVDDSSIVGLGSLDIQNMIKGPVQTDVVITVQRPRTKAPIEFTIRRESIPLYSVDAAYMMDATTGYVRIGRFAMTTHDEFVEHVTRLKREGLERLVLDLRDNPGGIKATAVAIADEMLDGEGTIVYTRGRDPRENEVDRITPGGLLTTEPVIVLVNESTASGSEIIAGALQDHDRALVVGRRTFGKGLVQRPFQLRDGSVLQMTVSRYYMPSGRLIQTPYTDGEQTSYYEGKFADLEQATYDPSAYLADIPDSLRFETENGRMVYGGGGVMPDRVVPPDSLSPLAAPGVETTLRAGLPFLFVRDWLDTDGAAFRATWENRQDAFMTTFRVDEELWDRFVSFVDEAGEVDVTEVEASRDMLTVILKGRIAQRLWQSEAWYPVFNSIDPLITELPAFWTGAETLSAYHGGTTGGVRRGGSSGQGVNGRGSSGQ